MSDKCFVDTNILVYAHDCGAGAKHERVRTLIEKLWSSGGGVVSTQVFQELCINLLRKATRPFSAEEIRRLIDEYSSWQVVVNSAESVLQALTMEMSHKISFWDALILQAAGSSGATVRSAEDLREGRLTVRFALSARCKVRFQNSRVPD
jgi:predicted nucleic acid-binding protein